MGAGLGARMQHPLLRSAEEHGWLKASQLPASVSSQEVVVADRSGALRQGPLRQPPPSSRCVPAKCSAAAGYKGGGCFPAGGLSGSIKCISAAQLLPSPSIPFAAMPGAGGGAPPAVGTAQPSLGSGQARSLCPVTKCCPLPRAQPAPASGRGTPGPLLPSRGDSCWRGVPKAGPPSGVRL